MRGSLHLRALRCRSAAAGVLACVLLAAPAQAAVDPAAGLDQSPIPPWIGVQGHKPFYVNATAGPANVWGARFLATAQIAGARWGDVYMGTTTAAPVQDGQNTVGFSDRLRPDQLGEHIVYMRTVYRRGARRCTRRRHGRRSCRRPLVDAGLEPTGEQDIALNSSQPWEPGLGHPGPATYDIASVLLHEFGHFSGNPQHASGCAGSPLVDAAAPGDWWWSPTDWHRAGC